MTLPKRSKKRQAMIDSVAYQPPKKEPTVEEQVEETLATLRPYMQHKPGCKIGSMISHAPMHQRICTCGLNELRERLTKHLTK